jgi:hypothetical protein
MHIQHARLVCACAQLTSSMVLDRAWVPVAVGLLPAMALGCLLVSNWASGRVPVETLGMQGGALVVDMEPNAPMRVVGEIEPLEMGMMAGYERQVLRQRYCGSECGQNMIICMKAPNANPGARECSKMKDECINVKCKVQIFNETCMMTPFIFIFSPL